MRKFASLLLLCTLLVASASAIASAQAPPPLPRPPAGPPPPPPAPPQPPSPPAPLPARVPSAPYRIDILVQRTKGTTIVSSFPYSLYVAAAVGGRATASLRLMSQVPFPADTFPANYQSVGTNIDCFLTPQSDGRVELQLTIDDSSLANQGEQGRAGGPPIIRSYRVITTLVLSGGQPSQVNLSTDKAVGETVTAQVTVTALKP